MNASAKIGSASVSATFLVDAIFFAQTFLAVARVERRHAFVENIKTAADERRRIVTVERVIDSLSESSNQRDGIISTSPASYFHNSSPDFKSST